MYTSTVDHSGYFSLNKKKAYTETDQLLSNLKINCNQVSPTLGKLLEYEDLNLPFKKKKMIKHVFEKVNDQKNLITQMKFMFQEKEVTSHKKKELKVNQKGKTLIDHYNLRAPQKEYYQKHQNLDKYFKDMLDINYVLNENEEKMSNLPSSIEILKLYKNKFVRKMHQEQEEKLLKDKLIDQAKQIEIIENLKRESGNQDILDLPFDGSRAEGRKLIAYVHAKCRNELDIQDQQLQLQKQLENEDRDSRLKRMQSEGLLYQNQLDPISQSSNMQKTFMLTKEPKLEHQNTNSEIIEQLIKKTQNQSVQSNFNVQIPLVKNPSQTYSYNSTKLEPISKQCLELESTIKLLSAKKPLLSDLELVAQLTEQPQIDQDSMDNHRKIRSRVMQKDETTKPPHHGNLPDYILQRLLDPGILYEDKRREYKSKYNQIFDNISIDSNINELCHNILQKRNLFSHSLKKKHS